MRLSAVDPEAAALGLTPGMSLADARARLPDLEARPMDPEADRALLDRLVADFDRFSPMVARDEPWGLVLDVTGCAHLFGGEAGLMAAVRGRAQALGLQARLALARTPQTARALARFGPGGRVEEGQDGAVAGRLPVAALDLPPADHQALRRAGLMTLADVDARERTALAARFGADFPTRMDRLMGREDVRISPVRPPPAIRADRILAEPITETEQVETVLADLLGELEAALEPRGLGVRRQGLILYRVDGDVRRLVLRTARPQTRAAPLLRLWRERLAALARPLDPGFGYDQLRLAAEATEPLVAQQPGLDQPADLSADFKDLIDRLSTRLGPEAVLRFQPVQTHLPERASRLRPAQASQDEPSGAWPQPAEAGGPPLRPLQLFDPPQPIEAIALAPDSPPARFRWRRVTHQVTRAEGPERIEPEWWRRRERVRDYYRVEDQSGRRFWLFRAGGYGGDPPPRWYLHGLFP